MGHGITETDTLFSVRERPWHGLGKIIAEAVNIEDALELSGLGKWGVEKRPIFDEKGNPIKDYMRTVRVNADDTAVTLGVVMSDYEVIVNRTLFEVGEAISGTENEAGWEVAGSFYGGKRVWMTMKLDKERYIGGERLDTYFLVTSGHDGRHGLKVVTTPIRGVCQNTVSMALQGAPNAVSLRHTKNYEERLGEAAKALGLVKKYYDTFETFANNLLAQKFAKAEFEAMLDTLLLKNGDGIEKTGRALVQAELTRQNVLAQYGAADLNNIRSTKWGALQAVAAYSDHGRDGKATEFAEERVYLRTFEDTSIKVAATRLLAPEWLPKASKANAYFANN